MTQRQSTPLHPWLISPPNAALRLHDPACLIIDARPAGEYAAGHLAAAAAWDVMASPCNDTAPAPLAAYVERVAGLLQGLGLEPDHQVIVYDARSGNQAARAFWLLQWLGHPSVQMLDGGLGAWQAAGLSLTTASPTRGRGHFAPTRRDEVLSTMDHVRAALEDPATQLLDTRSAEEYTGAVARSPRCGHIPGAIHLEWKDTLKPDGTFRSPENLAALYRAKGFDPGKQVIAYCQGGYRGAHGYIALSMAGFTGARNYLGSWAEWGSRTDTPVAT